MTTLALIVTATFVLAALAALAFRIFWARTDHTPTPSWEQIPPPGSTDIAAGLTTTKLPAGAVQTAKYTEDKNSGQQ